jgi:multisubunit Na+/H+ antiporter MnhE subunit
VYSISYGKIVIGIIVACIASFWTRNLGVGSFITLLISAVLFFSLYGISLLIMHEELVQEVSFQLLAMVKRISKKG